MPVAGAEELTADDFEISDYAIGFSAVYDPHYAQIMKRHLAMAANAALRRKRERREAETRDYLRREAEMREDERRTAERREAERREDDRRMAERVRQTIRRLDNPTLEDPMTGTRRFQSYKDKIMVVSAGTVTMNGARKDLTGITPRGNGGVEFRTRDGLKIMVSPKEGESYWEDTFKIVHRMKDIV